MWSQRNYLLNSVLQFVYVIYVHIREIVHLPNKTYKKCLKNQLLYKWIVWWHNSLQFAYLILLQFIILK